MFRKLPYTILLIVLLFLQLFVFDKLLISTFIAPMIYIAFIILLPMRSNQLTMLMWGTAIGVLFDLVTGMSGINSISTIFVSYLRIWILSLALGKDMVLLGISPLPRAVGVGKFARYAFIMVYLHSALLFTVEMLRFDNLSFLFQRILYSGAVSFIFVWVVAAQFENMLSKRR